MAKYRSRYLELSFYVGDNEYRFADGIYETDDPKKIEALSKIPEVQLVKEPAKAEPAKAEPAKATKK